MTGVTIRHCGMTTAIGLTGEAACAAQRAKLSNFIETHFISRDGVWIMGAEVPLDPPRRGRSRLIALLHGPLWECFSACADVEPSKIPVLLCVAEMDRPGRLDGVDGSLLADALAGLSIEPHPSSTAIPYGRVGGVVAMRDARKLLAQGAPYVIIAGVDSYLTADTLRHYDREDRVLTEKNSNGFPAGEAGAAIVVGPSSGDGLAVVGVGFGREEAHINSGKPQRAEGLVTAIRGALAEGGMGFEAVDYRISDLNGEQYYFKEASLSMSRLLRQKKEMVDLWNPASEFGYIGAAGMPALMGVALMAARKNYAPGPTVLLQSSDDDGRRGAIVLRKEG